MITYRSGELAAALPDGNGAVAIPDAHGEEFRINVFSFRPGTRAAIYSLDEVREKLTNGSLGNGIFYVQYGERYVGIEPLSLSAEDILRMIDSIGGAPDPVQ